MSEVTPENGPKLPVRRDRLRSAALLLLGFVLGGAVFSARSCANSEPEAETAAPTEAQTHTVWTCSMHPQIRQPEPGQCPICGMDLIPATKDETSASGAPERVVLSQRAQALARLRTTEVHRLADAAAELRLLGRIEADETTRKDITAWIGGRIDKLHVNSTGERVRAGQAVATMYSPEVFAAHQDLLAAKRQVDQLATGAEATRKAARAALEAARDRLRLLGIPDDELQQMETQPRPTRSLPIRSPFSGTVIERLATEGAYVSTGTPLYRIANLNSLWVQLDAYESDLAELAVGQPVRVEVRAFPGEEFEGSVTFIDPTLDPRTRTAQVRVQLNNQAGRLRPGMFAEATVAAKTGAEPGSDEGPLVIPASAPLFTGRRAVVYVEERDGNTTGYEPRTVRLGPRLGNAYPVVAGLSEGERVVTRGAFTLDADLQIQGGPSMMAEASSQLPPNDAPEIALTAAQRGRLAPVVAAYLEVQVALAKDALEAAKRAAEKLLAAVGTAQVSEPREAKLAWTALAGDLRVHAKHVAMAHDLTTARTGFEPLSGAIQRLLQRLGNPLDKPLNLAFCPMAAHSHGASWIQEGAEIENSYFGPSMRSCGEVTQQVAPGQHLQPAAGEPEPEPSHDSQHSHEGHGQ